MHHELAKYHEIGRFAIDGDENKIDWSSALFHEEHAAELGISEAIVTMAKIYLNLPHDVLVSCEVPVSVQLVLSYVYIQSYSWCYLTCKSNQLLPLVISKYGS